MTSFEEQELLAALRSAVDEAISVIGIDGVKEMSMFPSSKWNRTNDNERLDTVSATLRAA